jgi:predicted porin
MYNKKLLVAALGAAFSAPCAIAAGGHDEAGNEGADSVVVLYGKIYPEVVRPYGKDATAPGTVVSTLAAPPTAGAILTRSEVESSNSNFGVRGQERLGGGLKAIFQLETAFSVASNHAAFAQRDSFVGFAHDLYGTIKLGRMDTPFKKYGDDVAFLGVSSGNFVSSSNVLRKAGFGTNSASSFHLRRTNVVQYETANIAGFDAATQYSTDEADTSTRHPHIWSSAVRYEGGPLKVSLAYEEHWDLFGGSRNVPVAAMSNFNDNAVRSRDKATQGMIEYRLGRHTFEADVIWKKYDENATITGRFTNYKNIAYQVLWDARWNDRWRTGVQYIKSYKGVCGRVNAVCVTDGLDGSQLQFGVAYYFSKRTYAFAMAALLKNGQSAQYNNSIEQVPAVGEELDQYAIGINHNF